MQEEAAFAVAAAPAAAAAPTAAPAAAARASMSSSSPSSTSSSSSTPSSSSPSPSLSSLIRTVNDRASLAMNALADGSAVRMLSSAAVHVATPALARIRAPLLSAASHIPIAHRMLLPLLPVTPAAAAADATPVAGTVAAPVAAPIYIRGSNSAASFPFTSAGSAWHHLPSAMQRLVQQIEDDDRHEAEEVQSERGMIYDPYHYAACAIDVLFPLRAHAGGGGDVRDDGNVSSHPAVAASAETPASSAAQQLPVEACHRVCSMLDFADVTRCLHVSQSWRRFGQRVRTDRAFVHASARAGFGDGATGEQRGRIWQHLCGLDVLFAASEEDGGALPTPTGYQAILEVARTTTTQSVDVDTIMRDIPRTHGHHYAFLNSRDAAAALTNVLTAYAVTDRELGYTQGMNYLASYLLTKMPEERAYWMFHMLMTSIKFNLRRLLEPGFFGLSVCKYQFNELFRSFLPELHRHFEINEVIEDVFSKWFITLFTFPGFPIATLDRVWDLLMVDDMRMIHRTALAILKLSQGTLLLLDFEGIMEYVNVLPDEGILQPQLLIDTALSFPVTTTMLHTLELQYLNTIGAAAAAGAPR